MNPAIPYATAILVTVALWPLVAISQERAMVHDSLFGAGEVERILRLLDQRSYKEALVLADKSWGEARKGMLRRLRGSAEGHFRLPVSVGVVVPAIPDPAPGSANGDGWDGLARAPRFVGIDPRTFVVGPQTRADCQRIVGRLYSLDDPEAVPQLLSVSDKELSGHAIGAVLAMGGRLRGIDVEQGAELVCKALVAWAEKTPVCAEERRAECIYEHSSGLTIHCLDRALSGASPQALLGVYMRYMDGRRDIRMQVVVAAAAEERARIPLRAPGAPPPRRDPMVLLAALSDPDVGIRRYAATRLVENDARVRWSDESGTVRQLTRALGDPDSRVAIQAAASLASYSSPAGIRFLMAPENSSLLRSQDDGVRRCVGTLVMAMGEFGLKEGTPWIIAQCEANPELVPLAVETMWPMRDAASIDFLGEVLLDWEIKERVRKRALFSLSRTMENRAFPYLLRACDEAEKKGEWGMVSSCLAAMAMIHPDLSFDLLAKWARLHFADPAQGGDEARRRASGSAFLALHYKSGYPDVIGQLDRAPEWMRRGMERFWIEEKAVLDAWDGVRNARYAAPSPVAERRAWRKLASTVNSASKPTRRSVLQLGEFHWQEMVSRDGALRIRKGGDDGLLSLAVSDSRSGAKDR